MCCGRRLRVLVVGRVHRWWGLVMGAHPRLCCPIVCLCSSLAGDGDGCSCSPSPSFVSPGCALLFTTTCVALLGACVRCLQGMVVGACACPHPRSCCLAARSCWWWVLRPICVASLGACVHHWWGMVVGAHPCLRPSLCAHPCSCSGLHVTIVACRRGCVCWWGLVRCVWDERLTIG